MFSRSWKESRTEQKSEKTRKDEKTFLAMNEKRNYEHKIVSEAEDVPSVADKIRKFLFHSYGAQKWNDINTDRT